MTESNLTLAEALALLAEAKSRPPLSPLVPCAECWFKVEVPAETDDDGTEHPAFWECHRENIRLFPITVNRYNQEGHLQQEVTLESHWPDTYEDGSCGLGIRR